jgi:hypothetical protein
MRSFKPLVALAALLVLAGCHSAYIAATISNRSPAPLSLVELDYPSASFGTQSLAPGADYHYRFKVLGNGPTSVLWTDARHQDHKAPGPTLDEGDEGTLTITFTAAAKPDWTLQLLNHKPN